MNTRKELIFKKSNACVILCYLEFLESQGSLCNRTLRGFLYLGFCTARERMIYVFFESSSSITIPSSSDHCLHCHC